MSRLLNASRRSVLMLVVGALLLTSIGVATARALQEQTYEVVVQLADAPGLYVGNKVTILGVDSGEITEVVNQGSRVDVHLAIPDDVDVPVDANAIVTSPRPVSDRTVELAPAYVGGATMQPGAVIPMERTAAPMPVDEIFEQVGELATALGPQGANRDGTLSDLVATAARLSDGNGPGLRTLIRSLGTSAPALSATAEQMQQLLKDLDTITAALADNDDVVDQLFTNLETIGGTLADERDTLVGTLSELRQAMQLTSAFLRDNRDSITSSTKNLRQVSSALVQDLDAVDTTFRNVARGFTNFNATVDVDAPCAAGEDADTCPIAFGRLNTAQGSNDEVLDRYCEQALQLAPRFIVGSARNPDFNIPPELLEPLTQLLSLPIFDAIRPADELDSICFATRGAVQGFDGNPGAPAVPDLQLERFLD